MTDSNPYAPPPRADSVATPAQRGEAPRGEDFSIVAVLGEAWALAAGSKRYFVAVYVLLLVALAFVQSVTGLLSGSDIDAGWSMLLWQPILAAALYPFIGGVMRLALRRAANQPVGLEHLLDDAPQLGQIALLGALVSLATLIGFTLFVLPGIYLSVAFMFALPLVLERRLDAVAAMRLSLETVHRHWFRYAALLFVLGFVLALGAFTVIGLIWALPVTAIALALVYRQVFGPGELSHA